MRISGERLESLGWTHKYNNGWVFDAPGKPLLQWFAVFPSRIVPIKTPVQSCTTGTFSIQGIPIPISTMDQVVRLMKLLGMPVTIGK